MKAATTAALLKKLRLDLEGPGVRMHAQERLAQLRQLEQTLLDERIFSGELLENQRLPDRGQIAMSFGIHPSQASRLERRLITRIMAIVRARGQTVGEA